MVPDTIKQLSPGRIELLVLILFLPVSQSLGQNWLGGTFSSNYEFGQHLLNTSQFKDLFYLKEVMAENGIPQRQEAQINFLVAKGHYELKNFKKAGRFFQKARDPVDTGLSPKTFLGAHAFAKLKAYQKADQLLLTNDPKQPFHHQYNNYFRSGLAILRQDSRLFDSLNAIKPKSIPPLNKFASDLEEYQTQLKKIKDKKPWKGAVLSGIIPGLGKVYAGRPKSGLSAFLQLGLLGVQAYEGYAEKGLNDPQLYVFGGLFTAFYLGNIWGSANSVKKVKDEKYRKIEQEVLRDMRHLNDRFVE